MRARVVVAGIVFAAFWVASVASAEAGDPRKGKETYAKFCTTCHGAVGKGDGPMGAGMNPKPKDLSDKAYNRSLKDDYLVKLIKEGGAALGKSPMMPKFGGTLKESELADVIAFLRSLAK